jgi:ribosomal protein S6
LENLKLSYRNLYDSEELEDGEEMDEMDDDENEISVSQYYYTLAFNLSQQKILDIEKIFELNYINVLNFLSVQKYENERIKKQMNRGKRII